MDCELEMELAFHAGRLEEAGIIKLTSWEDLYSTVNEACARYYGEGQFENIPCDYPDVRTIADLLFRERFNFNRKDD